MGSQIAASFGDGWDAMVARIEAWRMDHLEDGEDLFAIVIELMINSYSDIHDDLKQLAGNDVLDRLRSAYQAGRQVMSGDELRQMKAALDANELTTVNTLMASALAQMGSAMDQVSAAFGAGFDEVLCMIQAYRAGHIIDGVDVFATVIDNLINSYPPALVNQLKSELGNDVMDKLRSAYFAGRSVVDSAELQQLADAISTGNTARQHELITGFKAEFAENMGAVKAAFGAGFDRMVQLIDAYRNGHLVNGVDLFETAVNIIIDSYDNELVALLKAASSDDVLARLRAAYFAGRSYVNPQELASIQAALDAQNFVEVQRLMSGFKTEMGAAMDDVAAAFGAGFAQVEQLIEAWRMDHLEDGQDLYGIVVEMMINSYSDIHSNLKQLAGDDVLDRLRSAYAEGREVISGDELRQMKAALDANNLATVNTLMQSALAQMGTKMDQVAAAFGAGFDEVLSLIKAYRAGHLDDNGNDLYAYVVNMIIDAYPTELVDLLKDASSDNVLDRLAGAYNAGRSVVDGQELRDLKAAIDAQNFVEVQNLMTDLKSQMGSAMADVGAAFGAGFAEVVNLIEAWRMNHLEDGDDLFAIVIEMMINSYADIHDDLKAIAGADVLTKLHRAYAACRNVVSGDDLRSLKTALENSNLPRVNELMAQFIAAMGQNMDAVSQAFGAGFDAVLNHISAYRAGHLVGGVDIFAQVIDQLINSYPTDLVDQLKAAVGDDVMSRLRTAYFAGRSVVDSSEIEQL